MWGREVKFHLISYGYLVVLTLFDEKTSLSPQVWFGIFTENELTTYMSLENNVDSRNSFGKISPLNEILYPFTSIASISSLKHWIWFLYSCLCFQVFVFFLTGSTALPKLLHASGSGPLNAEYAVDILTSWWQIVFPLLGILG